MTATANTKEEQVILNRINRAKEVSYTDYAGRLVVEEYKYIYFKNRATAEKFLTKVTDSAIFNNFRSEFFNQNWVSVVEINNKKYSFRFLTDVCGDSRINDKEPVKVQIYKEN